MTSSKVLMRCPKCGQKFRVVASGGTVHLTCPKCAAQWDWRESSAAGGLGGQMSSFWRAAVLRPRLSYAGSAAVLLAGLGLGVYLGHHEEAPAADNFSLPLPLPNAPPVVQPRAKSSRPTQPAAASDIAPIETLLPSNGVDFNTPSPLGTNL